MKRAVVAGAIASVVLAGAGLVSLAASSGACTRGWDAPTVAAEEMCRMLKKTNDLLTLTPGLVAYAALALLFVAIGGLVLVRAAGHPIGLVLFLLGMDLVAAPATQAYAQWALVANAGAPGGVAAAWVANVSGGPALFALVAAFFLLFPTGRIPSSRWRPVAWLLTAGGLGAMIIPAVQPGGMTAAPLVDNPLGVVALDGLLQTLAVPVFLTLLAVVLLAMASVGLRFRGSRGVERQQLKWVGASALVVGAALAATPIIFNTPSLNGLWIFVFPLAVATIPTSAGFAILRYRLYDIDLIIKRTLVYGALTAILGVTYFAIIVALQRALARITEESDVAVAASTLAVAALFGPLRGRVQNFIDRRFDRSRYDAQKTIELFSARLRDDIDLDHLTRELLGVVSSTMRPRHAAVWLRPSTPRPPS